MYSHHNLNKVQSYLHFKMYIKDVFLPLQCIFSNPSPLHSLFIIVSRQNLLWRFMCSFCHKKSDAQQKTCEAEKCCLQINQYITSFFLRKRGRKGKKEGRERKREYLFIVFFLFITFHTFPWFEIILIIFIYEMNAHG